MTPFASRCSSTWSLSNGFLPMSERSPRSIISLASSGCEPAKREFQQAHGFVSLSLPFVVHATVRHREFLRLTFLVVEDAIVEKKDVDIGIAVETERPVVLVVRHADRLSSRPAEAIEDISARAWTKRLPPTSSRGAPSQCRMAGMGTCMASRSLVNQVGIPRMGEVVSARSSGTWMATTRS